jgi:hypothetical protein
LLADIATVRRARAPRDRHLAERMARREDTVRAAGGSKGFIHPVIRLKLIVEMIVSGCARFRKLDFVAASEWARVAVIEQWCSVPCAGRLRPRSATAEGTGPRSSFDKGSK